MPLAKLFIAPDDDRIAFNMKTIKVNKLFMDFPEEEVYTVHHRSGCRSCSGAVQKQPGSVGREYFLFITSCPDKRQGGALRRPKQSLSKVYWISDIPTGFAL